uniref:Uncharacterized protein n=1 Tax=Anguilla anguilla TaxID=7936 RepID=A0A0E9X2V1_ANGAN
MWFSNRLVFHRLILHRAKGCIQSNCSGICLYIKLHTCYSLYVLKKTFFSKISTTLPNFVF